jgi:hypothetical protein
MYCYCKTQYLANPTSVFSIVFSDGKKYCQTWLSKYYLTNVLVIGVPVLIAVANALAKIILRYMSTLEKQQSVSVQIYSATINMMIMSIVNIGIVLLLVQLNIGFYLPVPIL